MHGDEINQGIEAIKEAWGARPEATTEAPPKKPIGLGVWMSAELVHIVQDYKRAPAGSQREAFLLQTLKALVAGGEARVVLVYTDDKNCEIVL